MSKILLIGPSGVGKSSALSLLAENTELETYDMDDLIKTDPARIAKIDESADWPKLYFQYTKEIIENMNSNKLLIFAIGAGSIEYTGGHTWYYNKKVILLTGKPEIIYPRSNRQQFHPTYESYKSKEFSEIRKKFYQKFHQRINVNALSSEEVVVRILNFISLVKK
jgi:shikimate kinase